MPKITELNPFRIYPHGRVKFFEPSTGEYIVKASGGSYYRQKEIREKLMKDFADNMEFIRQATKEIIFTAPDVKWQPMYYPDGNDCSNYKQETEFENLWKKHLKKAGQSK